MWAAVVVWVPVASAVTTAPTRSNASSRVRRAGISLLLTATCTCPRTTPSVWSRAATRCGATWAVAFAPRTVLPSIAMTRCAPSRPTRVRIHAPTTASSSSPSTRVSTRRVVASHGRREPATPSRAGTPASASATHSPIAVNERAPPRTAANTTASNDANRCRTPRRARGSVTCSNSSSRPGRARTPGSTDTVVRGEDDMAGVVLRFGCLCENFHPHRQHHARTSPRPACHTTKPQVTGPPPRLCRDPAVVTTTVTEAGYVRGADGGLDADRPEVHTDVAALRGALAAPVRTAPAKLVAGFAARRRAGAGGLTVVPCDNLHDNGAVAARVLRELAELVEPGLAEWLASNVSYVTTMVDRITPEPTAADLSLIHISEPTRLGMISYAV